MSKVDKLIFGNTKFLVFAIIRKTEKKKTIKNEAKNERSKAFKESNKQKISRVPKIKSPAIFVILTFFK